MFTLLYMPCVAAMAEVKRELGGYERRVGYAVSDYVCMDCAFIVYASTVIFRIGIGD